MTEPLIEPQFDFDAKAAALDKKIEIMTNLATIVAGGYETLADLAKKSTVLASENAVSLTSIREQIMPILQDMVTKQDKLRAVLLGKMDGLQGTMDLVREDTRNAWATADFAISNTRHVREETEKLLSMISIMQKQQQLLTSQVEELRRNANDKEQDL